MSSIDKKTLLGSMHQGATRGKDENEFLWITAPHSMMYLLSKPSQCQQ